jgi:GTP1/Obg family GTP-binding protein
MVGLITASRIIRERDLEREREALRRLEEERQREEMRRLKQIEDQHRQELNAMAESWRQSGNLRQFILESVKTLASEKELSSDSAETQWLTWACAYADVVDPLKNGELQRVVRSMKEWVTQINQKPAV